MYKLVIYIGDIQNAFCQSEPLNRAQGRVFVEPCDGVPVPPGSPIELIPPAYELREDQVRAVLVCEAPRPWAGDPGARRSRRLSHRVQARVRGSVHQALQVHVCARENASP
eukprot:4971556-Pyramimonas_sp.AAC.1